MLVSEMETHIHMSNLALMPDKAQQPFMVSKNKSESVQSTNLMRLQRCYECMAVCVCACMCLCIINHIIHDDLFYIVHFIHSVYSKWSMNFCLL